MEYAYDEEVELGRGGMAVVYEATHPDRPGTLALKRPLPFPHAGERLRREIEALTRVDDPNVMPVVDHGVDGEGQPWYAMPLALGSLKALWEAGTLGTDAETVCLDVLEDVCAGLGAIHAAGYVHRDTEQRPRLPRPGARERRSVGHRRLRVGAPASRGNDRGVDRERLPPRHGRLHGAGELR